MMALQNGSRKKVKPNTSIQVCVAFVKAAVDHIDLDMLAVEQGERSCEQKSGGKQVPLHFQKGVGADIQSFAYRRR